MNLLLDSSVALDFVAHRGPFFADARRLMIFSAMGDYDLWMSASQITDVLYVLTSSYDFSTQEGKERVGKFLEHVRVCSIDEADVKAAFESPWPDVEDALVHRVALKIDAEAIITRNKRDFDRSFVKVFDASGFFEWMESSRNMVFEEIDF